MDKSLLRSLGICGFVSVIGIVLGIMGGLEIHHMEHGAAHAASGHHADEAKPDEHGDKDSKDHGHSKTEKTEVSEKGHADKGEDVEVASHGKDHGTPPRNMNIFFSIYYFMTGLHAFHIIGGMIAITWLIVRAFNGDFRPDYFGPVDYVGLYWHLVDLIWIYLFPLLYLINM